MAASPAPLPIINLEESSAFFQGPFQQSAAWIEEKRGNLHRTLESHDQKLEHFALVTREFVDNLSALMDGDAPIDIDSGIDALEDAEETLRKDLARLTKLAEQKMRAAQSEPDLIVLMNEAIRGFSQRYRRFAAMVRDARWDLMSNRAIKQPSAGIGPIHGSGEPPEHPEAA